MRATLGFLLVIAFAAIAGSLLLLRQGRPEGDRGAEVTSNRGDLPRSEPDAESVPVPIVAPNHRTLEVPAVDPVAFRGIIHGALIDRVTRAAVEGEVRFGDRVVWTDDATGQFRFPVPSLARPSTLSARAAGYESSSYPLTAFDDTEPIVLELRAARTVTILVRNTIGAAIADAEIVELRNDPEAERVVGASDSSGRIELPATGRAIYARKEHCASSLVTIAPTEQSEIVLTLGADCAPPLRIVREGSGSAVIGLDIRFEALGATGPAMIKRRTGPGGLVESAIPRGSFLAVAEQTRLEPQAAAAVEWAKPFSAKKPGTRVEIEDTTVTLLAKGGGRYSVHVYDDATRSPIVGARAWLVVPEPAANGGEIRVYGSPVGEGVISLIGIEDYLQTNTGQSFTVAAPGYASKSIPNAFAIFSARNEVDEYLEAAPARSVRIMTEDTGAAGISVLIKDPSADLELIRGVTDGDGVIGPFAWTKKQLRIYIDAEGSPVPIADVPPEALDTESLASVEIGSLGKIVVHTGGYVGRVLCGRVGGARFSGVRDVDRVTFSALPAGSYVVGSPALLASLSVLVDKGKNAEVIELASGQTATVQWPLPDDVMADVTGVLRVGNSSTKNVVVIVREGCGDLPIMAGRFSNAVTLDSSGRFTLRDVRLGHSEAIFFNRLPNGETIPLHAAALSGAELDLTCSASLLSLRLRASADHERAAVRIGVPALAGRPVIGGTSVSLRSQEHADTVVQVGLVPTDLERLEIILDGKKRQLPIDLEEGASVLVDVDG